MTSTCHPSRITTIRIDIDELTSSPAACLTPLYRSFAAGDQLLQQQHLSSREIRRQLEALLASWQQLLAESASRGRGLEEAQDILDFNNQVEKVEAWIRDKVSVRGKGRRLTRAVFGVTQRAVIFFFRMAWPSKFSIYVLVSSPGDFTWLSSEHS